jgi:hypothetical protein
MVEQRRGLSLTPMSRLSYRLWFCAVLAIIAAGLANPCIEFASNAGWFGHGDFTDHSNIDVIPTLAFGIVFCAVVIVQRLSRLAASGSTERVAAWLRLSSQVLRTRNIAPFIPVAFGMQMSVLFAMESFEQLAVRGHVLGGALWLGAPIAVSLVVHGLFCVATAHVLTRALHSFARKAVRIARLLQALIPATGDSVTILPRATQTWLPWPGSLHGGLGERAPPSPSY